MPGPRRHRASTAFVDGMHAGVLVAAGVALVGAIIAFVWLPARASYDALAEPARRHRARGAGRHGLGATS